MENENQKQRRACVWKSDPPSLVRQKDVIVGL